MSKELDKIRKSDQRKQLLLLPLAILLVGILGLLYVFHFQSSFEIYGHHIWGATKYIWLTTAIVFLGFSLVTSFTLVFRLSMWRRLKSSQNFKLKKNAITQQVLKFSAVIALSIGAYYLSSLWLFNNVGTINGYLQFDSPILELVLFLTWIVGMQFVLGFLIGYIIFTIRAPFEFIKDNRLLIDYSANDGEPENID